VPFYSETASAGYPGTTVYGDNLVPITITQSIISAVTSTFLSQTGLDCTTTTLYVTTAVTNTYEISTSTPTYLEGTSTSYTSSDYRDGVTYSSTQSISQAATESAQVNFGYTAIPASIEVFEETPEQLGFKPPQAMKQSDIEASNLDIPASIYYPFTASVQQNVVVPIPTNSSTVQVDTNQISWGDTTSGYTNVTNWSYSWSSFSISYTSATSTTSSTTNETTTVTYSVWDSSSYSGSFDTDGEKSIAWQTGNTALGGFSPISTASETGVIVGALKGFRFDTLGDSVSSSIVYSTLGSTALSESVFAGLAESMFMTGTNAGGSLPYIGFTR